MHGLEYDGDYLIASSVAKRIKKLFRKFKPITFGFLEYDLYIKTGNLIVRKPLNLTVIKYLKQFKFLILPKDKKSVKVFNKHPAINGLTPIYRLEELKVIIEYIMYYSDQVAIQTFDDGCMTFYSEEIQATLQAIGHIEDKRMEKYLIHSIPEKNLKK